MDIYARVIISFLTQSNHGRADSEFSTQDKIMKIAIAAIILFALANVTVAKDLDVVQFESEWRSPCVLLYTKSIEDLMEKGYSINEAIAETSGWEMLCKMQMEALEKLKREWIK